MNKLQLLTVFILFATCFCVQAIKKQDYSFRHLDTEKGLSQNAVLCILQDRNGFMWFGTKDGLNRYDGNKIKTYRNEAGNANSLINNTVWSLLEQPNGEMWVGTEKGISIFDPKTEHFRFFDKLSQEGYYVDYWVTDMKLDKNGSVWIAAGQLFCFVTEKDTLIRTQTSHSNARAFVVDNNNVWVATTMDGVHRYSIRDTMITEEPQQIYRTATNSEQMSVLLNYNNSHLLLGTFDDGMKILDKRSGMISSYTIDETLNNDLYVRTIGLFSDGNIWIGTQSGLYIHDPVAGTATHLYHNLNDPYSLSDNAIYSLYEDKEGGFWVGTYFGGVCYYPKEYSYFKKDYPISNENSIIGERVSGICEDKYGNIWIGTEDAGLCKLDPTSYQFEHFVPGKGEKGLNYENVHDVVADDDLLWIGTFSHGINRYNQKTKEWKYYRKENDPKSIDNDDIFALYKDRSGNIWVGTSSSSYLYDRAADEFINLTPLQYRFVSDIIEDAQGNIWFATYANGAYCYNPSTEEYTHYAYDADDPDGICHYKITCLYVDSRQRLWLASESRGICMFDETTGKFIHYGVKDGFSNDVIYAIVEDDSGNLWLSTNAGLTRFNPDSKSIRLFTRSNGFTSNQFNYKSGFKDKSGRIYFGSMKGMISFKPSDFNQNDYVPPVVITDFTLLNNDEDKRQSITGKTPIELSYDQSSFSINFSALSFVAPEMNEYLYRMEGLEEQWNHLKQAREITYSNLSHGKYVFKVKGSNNDGLWNPKEDYLEIIVHPPFWLSTWAYICYTILVLILVFYLMNYYKKRIEMKNHRNRILFETQKEKEIYHAKIDFFTNVAHEVRTPLTLIKGPLEYILKHETDEKERHSNLLVMQKNTDRLLSLINQLLDFRKIEAQAFSLSFTREDVSELLKSVYIRFKPSAERRALRLEIKGCEQPIYADIDKEALTKIISNLFTNAIKFAEHIIDVQIKEMPDNRFSIQVRNDGPLIPTDLKEKIFEPFFQVNRDEQVNNSGSGIGLALVKSQVELHKGEVYADVDENNLNLFVVELPTGQENVIHLNEPERENRDVLADNKETEIKIKLSVQRETILIVEDSVELIRFVTDKLESQYTVLNASNGLEALALLEKEMVNLVISDIMMPGMDGLELCKQMKESQEYSHIPIILLTAKTNIQNKIEGLEYGADAYIEKPFSLEYLLVRIGNLLDNRRKIREAFTNSPLAHTQTIAVNKADEQFLTRLTDTIYKNMANSDFNVDKLAELMFMSRSSLLRKIKGVSEVAPNDFIKLMRLKKAAEILQEGEYKVNEVCYLVGFSSTSYFSKAFHKQFGVLPKDFIKNTKRK